MNNPTSTTLHISPDGAGQAASGTAAPPRPIPWEYDLANGCHTQVGAPIETLLGYPASDWRQPRFWADHLHPEDRHWVPIFRTQSAQRGEEHELEYRMRAADGRTVWLRDHATVVAGPQGAARLQGYWIDISEQKQVQDVMEALARASSSDDPDAFLQVCVRNLARAYNARFAFVGLLQPSRQDVLTLAVWAGEAYAPNFEYSLEGTPCKDVLDLKKELIPRDASRLYPDDAMLVQMGIDSYFGTPLIASDGTMMGLLSVMDTRPMALTRWTAPILGVFAARVAIELERKAALDSLHALNASLEQRVQARTLALEDANRELEAFAYSVSHDLRAPLRAIDGFTLALLEDYGDRLDATAQGYLQRVRAGTRNMAALIEDLLRLSRISQAPLQPAAVDLGAAAQEIAGRLRQQAPGRNVRLDIAAGLRVQGDPGLLRILLGNLFDNAWKYTGPVDAAHIVFDAIRQDGETVYRVRDNGVGFDMKLADKLFGAFQRMHRQDEFEGHGIGLATVRRIVHRHGGRIWAHAEPGRGATFHFTLGSAPPGEDSLPQGDAA